MAKEYGIMFTAPMVRAILEGRKTVTRRTSRQWLKRKPGDRLWVRETWAAFTHPTHEYGECDLIECAPRHMQEFYGTTQFDCVYLADKAAVVERWRPAMMMPRWASRILLEVTEAPYLDPLGNVDMDEAIREGFGDHDDPLAAFHQTIRDINGDLGMDEELVVVPFRVVSIVGGRP